MLSRGRLFTSMPERIADQTKNICAKYTGLYRQKPELIMVIAEWVAKALSPVWVRSSDADGAAQMLDAGRKVGVIR